jgi:uncharacterized membrane protein YkoI
MTLAALMAMSAAAARADDEQHSARDAYQRGEIMSLAEIRRNVQRDFNGQIIGTQFRSANNEDYIYKFRVLSPEGNMMTIDVDARTSRVIGIKGQR